MSDDVATPMLLLEFGGKDEQPTVRLRGHLTADTAGAFTTSLVSSGFSFGHAVVVDLSGVTRIDGDGLSALRICQRSLAEDGSQLILKRAS
jgi:anti-anti-sigma regulatory factor